MSMAMSFTDIKTPLLWRAFMPRLHEIKDQLGTDKYSAEVYTPGYFENFDPAKPFTKWAAVAVTGFDVVPAGMQTLTLQGQYAVFLHTGPASQARKTYDDIFLKWLPVSGYVLDDRPHFAVMGAKYKHDDPASEEEVWIPVREK